jgi:hypothetical protein
MKTRYVKVIATRHCRTIDPALLVGQDDFLSSSGVEPNRTAGFLFDLSTSRSLDSLFETKPDLYCVVSGDDGTILDRSDVHSHTDFLDIDPASGEQHRTIQIDFQQA